MDMLSDLQRKDVWEGWLGGEIRANYFAAMAERYQTHQKTLTWMTLLFSSGAFATLITDWLPARFQWVKPALALVTAAISLFNLVQQNQKRVTECGDLHFRWNRLASEYKALWDNMYSEDAADKLRILTEKEAELSRSSLAIPNDEQVMLRWQDYVLTQHRLVPAA